LAERNSGIWVLFYWIYMGREEHSKKELVKRILKLANGTEKMYL
jgi:hypothetical protein